jgi:nitrite reductase/ring-hydroxylating ferredoxin subunit
MGGRIALVLLLLAVAAVVAVGCTSGSTGGTNPTTNPTGNTGNTGNTGGTGGPIQPTWIGSEVLRVEGNSLLIPTEEVASGRMLHFSLSAGGAGKQDFMAYDLGGETYVRANVCPPCRSVGFSLDGDVLVCNSCGTRFAANTGAGISGACKDFPKAEATHAISGSDITIGVSDLTAAYENTEKPGWP